VPLSITQRALRSSHHASAYSACAGGVGDTAARQLPYPRTAPRHRVFVAGAAGWECGLPHQLVPHACRVSFTPAARRCTLTALQRRLRLAHSQHHKRRFSSTRLTALALRVGEHGDGLRGASSACSVSRAALPESVLLFSCSHLLHQRPRSYYFFVLCTVI
jgi:hypothetical protein